MRAQGSTVPTSVVCALCLCCRILRCHCNFCLATTKHSKRDILTTLIGSQQRAPCAEFTSLPCNIESKIWEAPTTESCQGQERASHGNPLWKMETIWRQYWAFQWTKKTCHRFIIFHILLKHIGQQKVQHSTSSSQASRKECKCEHCWKNSFKTHPTP